MSSISVLVCSGHSDTKVVGFNTLSLSLLLFVISYTADTLNNHLNVSCNLCHSLTHLYSTFLCRCVNVVKGSSPNPSPGDASMG